MTQSYRDLIVWQKSMQLAKITYSLTKKLPKEETFSLANQMRRAVISIPSNIAEGNGRNSKKEYAHFLSVARGSKSELETQLLLCIDLKYFQQEEADKALNLCVEVGKMLNAMISKFRE